MKIDSAAIRQLSELLTETGLSEIEVVDGEKSIRVNKGGMVMAGGPQIIQNAVSPAGFMPSDPTYRQVANMELPVAVAATHPGAVTSPMVGTVYLAPEPSAPPFVRKGASVKAGDTLLIIEAMKVMNQIKAEKAGTITHIMVEAGQPVEYGDVLVVIE
jgi:acetyl-CoA carboxylase biotin carboxyl carrier protein